MHHPRSAAIAPNRYRRFCRKAPGRASPQEIRSGKQGGVVRAGGAALLQAVEGVKDR
jgi:hypothetical protein